MEDQGLMIKCTRCGEMNRLPAVHCKRCGTRLDFETAEHRMLKLARHSGRSPALVAAKLSLAAVLALLIILILWPGQLVRTTGDDRDARSYRRKCEELLQAMIRGLPASQVIAEREINAHLQELVAAQPAAKGFSGSLQDIGARFSPGRAEVFVAIGRGPLTFTGHFFVRPEEGRLVVTGAKAGHLPLPGMAGRLYARTQAGLFRQLKNEARIARNLDGAAVGEGTIELLIRGGN